MKKYKYETHLHTYPVSRCAKATVEETLSFYAGLGYDGVFITNHFLDGNINISPTESFENQIAFYISDYLEAKEIGKRLCIKVFFAVELSYKGTDFLVYGLPAEWYAAHPELLDMKKSEELKLIRESGGFIVHAHPFREAAYIDHIRLFPRLVDGVEVINACRTEFENKLALEYAENYGLIKTAGSDNHFGAKIPSLSGMSSDTPIADEGDFVSKLKNGKLEMFFTQPEL